MYFTIGEAEGSSCSLGWLLYCWCGVCNDNVVCDEVQEFVKSVKRGCWSLKCAEVDCPVMCNTMWVLGDIEDGSELANNISLVLTELP